MRGRRYERTSKVERRKSKVKRRTSNVERPPYSIAVLAGQDHRRFIEVALGISKSEERRRRGWRVVVEIAPQLFKRASWKKVARVGQTYFERVPIWEKATSDLENRNEFQVGKTQ